MKKFTAQDLIDMGADLFDNKGFSRQNTWIFLKALYDSGQTVEDIDIDRIYDLIVG